MHGNIVYDLRNILYNFYDPAKNMFSAEKIECHISWVPLPISVADFMCSIDERFTCPFINFTQLYVLHL